MSQKRSKQGEGKNYGQKNQEKKSPCTTFFHPCAMTCDVIRKDYCTEYQVSQRPLDHKNGEQCMTA